MLYASCCAKGPHLERSLAQVSCTNHVNDCRITFCLQQGCIILSCKPSCFKSTECSRFHLSTSGSQGRCYACTALTVKHNPRTTHLVSTLSRSRAQLAKYHFFKQICESHVAWLLILPSWTQAQSFRVSSPEVEDLLEQMYTLSAGSSSASPVAQLGLIT